MVSIPETGHVYPLLGRPQDSLPSSTQLFTLSEPSSYDISYDASTTNLTYTLNHKNSFNNSTKVTLSFLSPITPLSTFRQSLPAAYFTVYIEGNSQVSVYTDVNGEWVSGDRGNTIVWDLSQISTPGDSSSTKSWKISREIEQRFTETSDRSEWGTLHFTGPSSVTHQAGTSAIIRQQFAEQGQLLNNIDRNFRRIMDEEPIFAFCSSLRPSNDSSTASVTFTLGLIQDPVVQFAAARGLTFMRPLWASYIPKAEDMIRYHYADLHTASLMSANYSSQLSQDSRSLGPDGYEDIVALSARQVIGATQFAGTPDNVILFLKEISSNGNFQTVDVIFPSFPFFLYTNPDWLIYLLEPLIEHQLSGQYPNNYSMHDLGTHFPNATGHLDGQDEYMPVEECGNMLIMGLAVVNALRHGSQPAFSRDVASHAHVLPGYILQDTTITGVLSLVTDNFGVNIDSSHSGDKLAKAWVERAYGLWKQWTGYLIRESLIPAHQLCTDDFAGALANQTNLALKGIIGIRAMSELSDLLHETSDAKYYKNISDVYIDRWQDFGLSRDRTHAKLAYTWYGSWTTIYNLFADALLCFHLPESLTSSLEEGQKPLGGHTRGQFIPNDIYTMQSKWYGNVLQRYGLPLDSRHLYTKSDWEFFAAAVSSKMTREAIVGSVALWVNETVTGTYLINFAMTVTKRSLQTVLSRTCTRLKVKESLRQQGSWRDLWWEDTLRRWLWGERVGGKHWMD